MNARRLAAAAVGAAVVIAAVVVVMGTGTDTSRVSVRLASANGLRDGTVVKMGGVQVGTIKKLRIDRHDSVVAELSLDRKKAGPVTQGEAARIVTSNLLGSKYIELTRGRRGGPSMSFIPADRVTYPVDLDQVLNVLDADTRTRLQILINEAGISFTGRAADFNTILHELPHDFAAAQRLVDQVASDNRTLGQAVEHSSSFVSSLATERRQLGRVVDVAQSTMSTVAARRAALRATLAHAPATLASAQRFFADLRDAVTPLRPAARAISATTKPLSDTLDQLPSFRAAAKPTLDEATAAAPLLTQLGQQATPVVRRAVPVLHQAAQFANTAVPLTRTLGVSVDDALGVVEGWARAIQQGDALGHIFRGKAMVSAEALRTVLDQLTTVPAKRGAKTGAPNGPSTTASGGRPPAAGQPGSPSALGLKVPSVKLPKIKLPEIKLPGMPPIQLPSLGSDASTGQRSGASQLLDYLLGR